MFRVRLWALVSTGLVAVVVAQGLDDDCYFPYDERGLDLLQVEMRLEQPELVQRGSASTRGSSDVDRALSRVTRPSENPTETALAQHLGLMPAEHPQQQQAAVAPALRMLQSEEGHATLSVSLADALAEHTKGVRRRSASGGPIIFIGVAIIVLAAAFFLFASQYGVYPFAPMPGGSEPFSKLMPKTGTTDSARESMSPTASTAEVGGPPTAAGPPTAGLTQQVQSAARRSVGPSPSDILPPVCPQLVLPHTEARFLVPWEMLINVLRSGNLDINSTSGRKLLHGSIAGASSGLDGQAVTISRCGSEDDPQVTVQLGSGSGSLPQVMQVLGQNGGFYGTLEKAPIAGFVLKCDGRPVMTLEVGSTDYRMQATSVDGEMLAHAGRSAAQGHPAGDADTWRLQVKPGYDAVLIVACMLAAACLGQE